MVLTSEAAAFAREETWTHEKSGVGDAVILYRHVSIILLLARAISYCFQLCLQSFPESPHAFFNLEIYLPCIGVSSAMQTVSSQHYNHVLEHG